MTHGLSTVWLISLAWSGTKLSRFLCHFESRPFARVLNYSAETNNKVSDVSRQCDTPKNKESSRGGRVSGWTSQYKWVTKVDSVKVQREWSSNGITSSYSMGQDTHTPLPSPSSLLSHPSSVGGFSSQSQKSCMDGHHLWQNLCPFHRHSQKLQKIADEGRAGALFQTPLPAPQHGFLNALGGSERIQHVFPNFALPQARTGVVFSRVGSEWFLSWPHYSVAVWPWASNSHFTA